MIHGTSVSNESMKLEILFSKRYGFLVESLCKEQRTIGLEGMLRYLKRIETDENCAEVFLGNTRFLESHVNENESLTFSEWGDIELVDKRQNVHRLRTDFLMKPPSASGDSKQKSNFMMSTTNRNVIKKHVGDMKRPSSKIGSKSKFPSSFSHPPDTRVPMKRNNRLHQNTGLYDAPSRMANAKMLDKDLKSKVSKPAVRKNTDTKKAKIVVERSTIMLAKNDRQVFNEKQPLQLQSRPNSKGQRGTGTKTSKENSPLNQRSEAMLLQKVKRDLFKIRSKFVEEIKQLGKKLASIKDSVYEARDLHNFRKDENKESVYEETRLELKRYMTEIDSQLVKDDDCLDCDFIKREVDRFTVRLPILKYRREILNMKRVLILKGATGCGKSTQIGQYLLDSERFNHSWIVCTQPRIFTADSLFRRVKSEYKTDGKIHNNLSVLDTDVGAGMRDCGGLVFTTDKLLLQRIVNGDYHLKGIGTVMIDEVHERTIDTDVLLFLLRFFVMLRFRKDLKLIITSATMDVELLQNYFSKLSLRVVECVGRQYSVDIHYSQREFPRVPNFSQRMCAEITKILRGRTKKKKNGGVLVFLPSVEEVEKCYRILKRARNGVDKGCLSPFCVIRIHENLSKKFQEKVFMKLKPGKFKQILATNICETSITIPGIVCVIDSGLSKEWKFSPSKNVTICEEAFTSQSSALQRAGRAGRTENGECFRLYTRDQFDLFVQNSVPEVQRCNLGVALLKIKKLGFSKLFPTQKSLTMVDFFLEPPKKKAVASSLVDLKNILALDKDGDLTEFGHFASSIPVSPELAKILHEGHKRGRLLEMVEVAGMLSVGYDIFFRKNSDKNATFFEMKMKFAGGGGGSSGTLSSMSGVNDLWVLFNIFQGIKSCRGRRKKRQFVQNNRISWKKIEVVERFVQQMKSALSKYLSQARSSSSKISERIHLAEFNEIIVNSLFSNCAIFNNVGYVLCRSSESVYVHPSSLLALSKRSEGDFTFPTAILFFHLLKTSKTFARLIFPVERELLEEVLKRNGFANWIEDLNILRKADMESVTFDNVGTFLIREKVNGKNGDLLQRIQKRFKIVVETFPEANRVVIWSHERGIARAKFEFEQYLQRMKTELKGDLHIRKVPVGVKLLMKAGGVSTILLPNEFNSFIFHFKPSDGDVYSVSKDELQSLFSRWGRVWQLQMKLDEKRGLIIGKVVYAKYEVAMSVFTLAPEVSELFGKGKFKFKKQEADSIGSVGESSNVVVSFSITNNSLVSPFNICEGFINFQSQQDFQTFVNKSGIVETLELVPYTKVDRYNIPHFKTRSEKIIRCGVSYPFTIVFLDRRKNSAKFQYSEPLCEIRVLKCIKSRCGVEPKYVNFLSTRRERSGSSWINQPTKAGAEYPDSTVRKFLNYETIVETFSKFGTVANVHIPKKKRDDRDRRRIRRFFVRFTSHEEAKKCCAQYGTQRNGARVKIGLFRIFVDVDDEHEIIVGHREFKALESDYRLFCRKLEGYKEETVKVLKIKRGVGKWKIVVKCEKRATKQRILFHLKDLFAAVDLSSLNSKFLSLKSAHGGRKWLQNLERRENVVFKWNREFPDEFKMFCGGERRNKIIAFLEDKMNQGKTRSFDDRIFTIVMQRFNPTIMKEMEKQLGKMKVYVYSHKWIFKLVEGVEKFCLEIRGVRERVEDLKKYAHELFAKHAKQKSAGECDCSICYCSLQLDEDNSEESFGLSLCGCKFHRNCLKEMLKIQNVNLPVKCPTPSCRQELIVRDIVHLLEEAEMEKLAQLSFRHFKNQHVSIYLPCPTPNCSQVYKKDEFCSTYNCLECGKEYCKKCKKSAHDGLPCNHAETLDEKTLRKYHIKKCPRCGSGIQKDGGCNKVICLNCNAKICWMCLKDFDDGNRCYEHIRSVHGNVFGAEPFRQ